MYAIFFNKDKLIHHNNAKHLFRRSYSLSGFSNSSKTKLPLYVIRRMATTAIRLMRVPLNRYKYFKSGPLLLP